MVLVKSEHHSVFLKNTVFTLSVRLLSWEQLLEQLVAFSLPFLVAGKANAADSSRHRLWIQNKSTSQTILLYCLVELYGRSLLTCVAKEVREVTCTDRLVEINWLLVRSQERENLFKLGQMLATLTKASLGRLF